MSSRPLAVIVPSRGRPEAIADLVHVWWKNSCDASDLYVVVDSDDGRLGEYREIFGDLPGAVALAVQPTPGSMVAALNMCARRLAKRYFALGFMGDDHRPRTACWDTEVVAALELLGTGIVTGPDGIRSDQLPTWCVMTSDIVKTLGYMAPPDLQHMYVDDAWRTLGQALNRFAYLPNVLVEHMHPVAGKAPLDEGYLRVNDPGVYARDEAQYVRWLSQDLDREIAKIKAIMPSGVDS